MNLIIESTVFTVVIILKRIKFTITFWAAAGVRLPTNTHGKAVLMLGDYILIFLITVL